MSNKEIESLIRLLNNGKGNEQIFIRPLTDTVDYAMLWMKQPKPVSQADYGPHKFYFIKNTEGVYAGAVYDALGDLQWYISPRFRKKGFLSRSLKEVILPHLFQDRERQIITIDINAVGAKNFKASENVVVKAGFINTGIENGVSTYVLLKPVNATRERITGKNTTTSEGRINELGNRMLFFSRSISLIAAEVEMKTGNDKYTGELNALAAAIRAQENKMVNLLYELR